MLLREVERYIRQSGTPPSRLGREALGDPRFVHDLRMGREPRPKTAARVVAWLREHAMEVRGPDADIQLTAARE